MAGDITLSSAVRSNLLSLQNTASLLARTQERLSTGKKVNSALDNPTNFFTASSLSARSNRLSSLLDSVSNGIQVIKAADQGITSLTKLVEQAQATARDALQAPKGSYEYQKAEILGTVSLIGDTAAVAVGAQIAAADVKFTTGNVDLAEADHGPRITGSLGFSATTDVVNDTGAAVTFDIDVNNSGTATTITVADGATLQDVIDDISAISGLTASLNATTGRLEIRGDDTVDEVEITGADASVVGLTAGTFTSGNDILDSLSGQTLSITVGTTTTDIDLDATNNTTEELLAELNGIAGIAASIDADGQLKITAVDATETLTIGGDDEVVRSLGLRPGVVEASNSAFTAAGVAGQKLTISVNDGSTIDFVLGDGAGQIGSKQELVERLSDIEGITASFNGANQLVIEADDTSVKFRIGGDAAALNLVGLSGKTYSASNTDLDDLAGKTINVSVGTSSKTIKFGDDAGIGQVNSIAELKAELAKIGAVLEEVPDASGGTSKLKITTSDEKASKNITIGEDSDTYALTGLGLKQGTTESVVTAIIENNEQRSSAEEDYNDLLKQIDALARDASYNGVNLLNGDDLTVIFNEDGSSKLDITGVKFDAEGLGLETVTLNDFQDDNKINAVLSKLDGVLTTLRAQSSRFGSNLSIVQSRQDFTKNMVNVLDTGAANLTLADTNEEGANMLALQTRQQLSTTALSLASQADQAVLRLF